MPKIGPAKHKKKTVRKMHTLSNWSIFSGKLVKLVPPSDQASHFKAKMHQIRFPIGAAHTALPQTFWGVLLRGGNGKGRGREWRRK